jgi:hypothetical protein
MTEPIVTMWTDKTGVQHWGSVDSAPGDAKPVESAPSPSPREEVKDAPEVPANGDGSNSKPVKR